MSLNWASILNALQLQSLVGELPHSSAVNKALQIPVLHSVYAMVPCRSRYLQLLLWGAQALTVV